jgi:hypothetical protein
MGSNRLDDCGRCELLPTTTGWVRATQVRCPIHGSRPAALPADPTPPPVPADTLPEEWITAAAEAIEDVMIRRLGRDLGTIHRDEIVAAGLAAVVPLARAEGVAAGRTAAAAPLRAAADARREYAALREAGDPPAALGLRVEAELLEAAARVADGDLCPMCGWLPSWRWTAEMNAARVAEGTETDG